jgi:hypothetical protein
MQPKSCCIIPSLSVFFTLAPPAPPCRTIGHARVIACFRQVFQNVTLDRWLRRAQLLPLFLNKPIIPAARAMISVERAPPLLLLLLSIVPARACPCSQMMIRKGGGICREPHPPQLLLRRRALSCPGRLSVRLYVPVVIIVGPWVLRSA